MDAAIVNEDADTVVIEINTVDLPNGTVSIQLHDGEILELGGSDTVRFTVKKSDLDNGSISMIAMNDEGIPLATLDIQIDMDTSAIPDTADHGFWHVLLWILVGIAGLGLSRVLWLF